MTDSSAVTRSPRNRYLRHLVTGLVMAHQGFFLIYASVGFSLLGPEFEAKHQMSPDAYNVLQVVATVAMLAGSVALVWIVGKAFDRATADRSGRFM